MVTVFSKVLTAVLDYLLFDLGDFLVGHFLEARNVFERDMYKIQVPAYSEILAHIFDLMLVGFSVQYGKDILNQAGAP